MKNSGFNNIFKSNKFFAYTMILPSLIMIILVVFYPLILVFRMSISEISFAGGGLAYEFHGLKTYIKVVNDFNFITTIKNSLHFAFYSVTLSIILGFVITLALDKIKKGVNIFRTIILLPWIAPLVVSGMMWKWVLNDIFGIVNYILLQLNIVDNPVNWVGNPATAMKTVIWADIWAFTPFCVIILYAGLQQIPNEIFESAKVDGAGPIRTFFYITLPMLKRFVFIVLLIRTIFALRVFDIIYVLTKGGPGNTTNVLGLEIYRQGTKFLNLSNASALSVITLILTFSICLIYFYLFGRD